MKMYKYEKYTSIFILSIFLIVVEIGLFSFVLSIELFCYRVISGIVIKENEVLMVVSEEERKLLYKNHTVIINDKKVSYSIGEDKGILLKNGSNSYYEIVLEIKTPKNKQYNDALSFTIRDKKQKIINIIKTMWEGDRNENNE